MKYNENVKIGSKTVLSQGAEVIRHFNELNQSAFTLREAAELLKDSSHEAVKKMMRDMVQRGLLLRLKDGVYWIIPYDQPAAGYFPNTHLVARYLVGEVKHYIGYYSALELHSLITQPSFREQIVVNKQMKPANLKIKDNKFQFIYHNEHHFFGTTDVWVDSFNKATCSDLEKTFVDCLFKPDYSGGITEIAKALYKSRDRIDYKKLLSYCQRFQSQSVIKRLGFLMDLLEINNPIVNKLRTLRSPSFILLEPGYEKTGSWNSKWYVQQNIENTDITSPIYS